MRAWRGSDGCAGCGAVVWGFRQRAIQLRQCGAEDGVTRGITKRWTKHTAANTPGCGWPVTLQRQDSREQKPLAGNTV